MANSSSDLTPLGGTSPSRRQFFHTAGIAAGGLYALAAPSLVGPWVTGAEAAETKQRSYITGRFGLELDGVFCGMISSFEGGHYTAEVVSTSQGFDRFPRKSVGAPRVEPITVDVGFDMTKPWFDWISKTLNLELVRKNGAIIEMDQSFKEIGRRGFTNAFISEIEFPACDAGAKTPATMTVIIASDGLKLEGGSGKQISSPVGKRQKAFVPSNYRLNIQGLEQATQKATKIEAFGFKQKIAPQPPGPSRTYQALPASPDFTNLAVTIPEAFAGPMYAWLDDFVVKGNNSSAKERPGVLEFLTPDLKSPIAAVQFHGLGIFRVATEGSTGSSEKARQTKVDMYYQRLTATFNP